MDLSWGMDVYGAQRLARLLYTPVDSGRRIPAQNADPAASGCPVEVGFELPQKKLPALPVAGKCLLCTL